MKWTRTAVVMSWLLIVTGLMDGVVIPAPFHEMSKHCPSSSIGTSTLFCGFGELQSSNKFKKIA
jgi:hypothetical protein